MLGLASSCKNDDDSNLGLGVQPPSDNIATIVSDSFTVLMTTIDEDSVRSDILNSNPVGLIDDPIFGQSTATLYTEVRLPDREVDFGTNPVVDSVVLTLRYSTISDPYGDVASSQTFTVYQLTDLLDQESYYSNTPVAYNDAVELGSVTEVFNYEDSIDVLRGTSTIKWGAHLRINIDDATFINSIINADPTVFADETNFRNLVKGLAIVPTAKTGTGVIASFDMLSAISNLTVYYNDTSYYDFLIDEAARRVTNYSHNNLPASISVQFDELSQDHDTTYAQSMGRVKTLITFPNLLDLVKDETIALKAAEIEFFVDQSFVTDNFKVPARLLIVQPDPTNGLNAGINPLDLNRAPGSYNSTTGSYKFSITSHLQEILLSWFNDKVNNNRGLYLIVPSDNPATPSRVVIDASKTKLKLFYNRVN